MSVRQIIKDNGYSDRMREIKEMKRLFSKVGFPENGEIGDVEKKKTSRTMAEVIEIAAVHEFGAPKRNIPMRAFLRPSFDENFDDLQEFKKKQAKLVIEGEQTALVGMSKIGEWLTNKTKEKIASGIPPELSPATIKRKGSTKTLIDTGQMLNSVQHVEVHEK